LTGHPWGCEMPDVFISYAREDRDFAQRLARCLEDRGLTVWWDWDLIGGENYRAKIRDAITDAKKAVVLWSRVSVVSGFVIDEATEARRLGKLIPISIDRTNPPFGFGDLHTIALDNPDTGLEALIAALAERATPREQASMPRRRLWRLVAASLVFGCISALAAGSYWLYARILGRAAEIHSAQRIALVVGISDYQHLPTIPNAVRDADRVADALEKRGFKVMKEINLDRLAMIKAVTEFESALAIVGGIGLFYYAGSAAYIDGEDIMLPVDAIENNSQSKIKNGVNLTQLLKDIQAKTTEKMTNNGRAVIYSASKGELAADGPPGGNSPFTKAFIGALAHPDDELSDVFRRIRAEMGSQRSPGGSGPPQTPFFEDTRSVKFYFNRADQDTRNGILKILLFDSCRDNPFKLGAPTG
jgi:hypothetical protein